MKLPKTPENIFEDDPTKSILNLLIAYKDVGLSSLYIRYALENDHAAPEEKKDIKKGEKERNIQEMQEFFGNKLEYLQKDNSIEKGCINGREHLHYYLRLLGEKNLGIIEKKGKYKKALYFINQDYYNEGKRTRDKLVLDHYYLSDALYENESLTPDIGPILRVYGMSPKVMEHAKEVDMGDTLFSKLEKIEELSLEVSEAKDETGRRYKIKQFREKCRLTHDEKMIYFVQENIGIFRALLNEMEEFYYDAKDTKNVKGCSKVDKEYLISTLNNIRIYPDGFTLCFNVKEPPYTKGIKKDLSSDQIKKLADAIVMVDEECREIYSKDVYPSIFIDQPPSRVRTGEPFIYFKVLENSDEIRKKLEMPNHRGTFIPMSKKDIDEIRKKP